MRKKLAYQKPLLRSTQKNDSRTLCNSGSSAMSGSLNSCNQGPGNINGTCTDGYGAIGTSNNQCAQGYEATGNQGAFDSGCVTGYAVSPSCLAGTNNSNQGKGYCITTGSSANVSI